MAPAGAAASSAGAAAARAVGGLLRHAAHRCRLQLLGGAGVVLPALAATTTAAFTPTAGRLPFALGLRRPRPQPQSEEEPGHLPSQRPLSSSFSSWWVEQEQEQELQPAGALLGLEGHDGPLDPESEPESPSSFLGGLWDGLVRMAVPKKKASHRRQRRRLVRYDGENIVHAYECPACGKQKLRHRLCDDYERCAQQAPPQYQRRDGDVAVAGGQERREGEGEGRA